MTACSDIYSFKLLIKMANKSMAFAFIRLFAFSVMFVFLACYLSGVAKASPYIYRETENLIQMVSKAHDLLIKNEKKAFEIFTKDSGNWRHNSQYLFVYDDKGKCLYNPGLPNLVGKNLIDLHDLNNKPVIKEIVEITKAKKADASGWVFYSWPDPSTLSSEWKAAYVKKVVLRDGRVWVVGSGIYNMKVEPVFVTERVDDAAKLIEQHGIDDAVSVFRNFGEKFVFLGVYLFVIDRLGNPIFHPGFPSSADENLTSFKDYIGEHPIKKLLNQLKISDSARVQFLYTGNLNSYPQKKLCYAHKAIAKDKQTYYVGACYSLEKPIWLK